jgi:hypothetical protein
MHASSNCKRGKGEFEVDIHNHKDVEKQLAFIR